MSRALNLQWVCNIKSKIVSQKPKQKIYDYITVDLFVSFLIGF